MNTLRTILIVLLMVGLTLFAVGNNSFVPVNFGIRNLEIWLPLLVLVSFVIGFLPAWLKLSTDRMLLRRRVTKLEGLLGRSESELAQAKTELLRPPAASAPVIQPAAVQPQTVPQPAPPPGT